MRFDFIENTRIRSTPEIDLKIDPRTRSSKRLAFLKHQPHHPHERSMISALKATLHQRGFRLTQQRQLILQIFQSLPQGQHLSAEELHQILRDRGERTSLSTIYRTLHVMTQLAFLRELEFAKGHKYYELNSTSQQQHHHLVCVQCNQTLEFTHDQIPIVGKEQAQQHGYHLLDCQLTLHVLCPEAVRRGWRGILPKDWRCDRARQRGLERSPPPA